MKRGGNNPKTILLMVLLIVILVVAAVFTYIKYFVKDGDKPDIDNKQVVVDSEGNRKLVDSSGSEEDLPEDAVFLGGPDKWDANAYSEMNEVFEQAEAALSGTGEDIEKNDPDTENPNRDGENGPVSSDSGEGIVGEGLDQPGDERINDLGKIVENAFDTAQLSLLYFENKEKYLEMLGYKENQTDTGTGDTPGRIDGEDKPVEPFEEQIIFLKVYAEGTQDKSVASIQERLMKLGFMEFAEPTEYYGSITIEAVKLFQRQNGLKQDGIIGEKSIGILFDENAKSYLLKKDMDGEDIRRVQNRLYELGYIATKDSITGHFGDITEAAVKSLQKANKLTPDGMVGVMTNELLYSENVKANIISFGEKSDVILECQKKLKELGYLTTNPDGYYGDDTLAAVKQFQSRNDCIVDGYLGPSTRAILISGNARPNGLVLGDNNDNVKKVQKLLIKYGYLSSGNDTGYFGNYTESAVKKFQQRNGLTADGNVGQKTMSVLTGSNVVRASSGDSGNSGNDGYDPGNTISYSCSPDDLIAVAKSKLGCKYVWGAKGPNTFDCSGFVYWCLNQIGVKQSYITSYGWRTVNKYKKITNFSSIKKGDIIVVYGHVGIAAGNGEVIDASSSNGKIVHRTMGSWWTNNFICAWRIFD